MKIRILERAQIIPLPLDETFRFFSDARNLERLTPRFLNFKFLSTPPEVMQTGTIIDYQIRLCGVPVHWCTRIEAVEPPHRFVDVQDKGPYRFWRHTHTFRDAGNGTTEIKDRVEYAMPLGPLGEFAHRLFVARSLQQIFDFRSRELVAIMLADRITQSMP
ncbi:MAG: SRPBCC family protein [Candidatus Binatus sp.]|uniref:SRPBCC family protein n=1 Tax=Candidatus Binatus sp. TaxID=2811406 RepID=UPI00271DA482|nr:SRPBCC family protein [Candidatus Binatus sp.]MDO8434511.1 SRPBCC family protein [Candidatus Binatus sp.]